jgi:hypothetical protein
LALIDIIHFIIFARLLEKDAIAINLVLLFNLWKIESHQVQSTRKWLAQKLLEVHLSCYEQNVDG